MKSVYFTVYDCGSSEFELGAHVKWDRVNWQLYNPLLFWLYDELHECVINETDMCIDRDAGIHVPEDG